MERYWHLKSFRRFWWVIAASVVVAMGVAFVLTETSDDPGPPRTLYEATTKLFSTQSTGGFQVRGDAFTDPAIVIEFLESPEVANAVKADIGFEGTIQQLTAMVEGEVAETGLIEITATSTRSDLAEEVSRAFTDGLLARLSELKYDQNQEKVPGVEDDIRDLKAQIEELESSASEDTGVQGADLQTLQGQLRDKRDELAALNEPVPDPGFELVSTQIRATPIETSGFEAPRSLAVRLGLAVLLGVMGGIGIALVMGRFDTRIRTMRQAEERFGLPVLAEIPVLPRSGRSELIVTREPGSRYAEAFRLLGAEIAHGPRRHRGGGNGKMAPTPDGPPGVIVVTSAGPGEGKTTVAANLAAALADMERRVIVLSCDFRRPKIHALFGVEATPGLAEFLEEEDDDAPILERVAVPTGIDGVTLVPSGRVNTQPTELLNSSELRRLLAEARAAADFVVVDTTPILAVSDAAFMVPEADAVLLVARSGRTTGEVAERTAELLARLGCPVIGIVLNRAAESVLPKGYRTYYERRPQPAATITANGSDDGSRSDGGAVVGAGTALGARPDESSGGDSPTSDVTRRGDRI